MLKGGFIESVPLLSRVPDATALGNYRISHLDSMYERVSRSERGFTPHERYQVCETNLH
ncbi:hypothetical protein [uncultured Helicobacter sp.]|uniref:hypothetical protein n=1 Tax=uncultured Helicobacter sp. TaxID=175537 RepID=UPI0037527AC5